MNTADFRSARGFIAGAFCLALFGVWFASSNPVYAQGQTVNLADAVAQKMIQINLKGTGELFFQDGLAYTIHNLRNVALTIIIPVGQVFDPDDPGIQPLIVAKEYRLTVQANSTLTGKLTTFCIALSKHPPDATTIYHISPLATGKVKQVADAINRKNAQGRLAGQFALWAVTDNFTLDAMQQAPQGQQNEMMQYIRPLLALARNEIILTQDILDDSGTGIKFYSGQLPDKIEIPGVPNLPGVPTLPDLGPLQRALDLLKSCGCVSGLGLLMFFVLRHT